MRKARNSAEYAEELVKQHEAEDERWPRRNLEGDVQPVTPWDWMMRAATYEWRCTNCDGPPLYLGPAGGNLPFECECDHSDGTNVAWACLLAGKRFEGGTAAALNGVPKVA